MPSSFEVSVHFFVQLAVTLAACWAGGAMLRRFGQPQVVADMVVGFVLGPTLLGLVFPTVQQWLFPATAQASDAVTVTHPSLIVLYVVGQLGLVLYMFVVGLSFDGTVLRSHIKSAAGSSIAGVLTPIAVGGVLGWILADNDKFFGVHVAAWQAAMFVGAAMAITAFPMLARIIYENGLSKTATGTVALACAAVDDTIAWVLLALVVSTASGDPSVALMAIGGGTVYVVVMLTVGRRLTHKIGASAMADGEVKSSAFILMMVVLLLCAAFTDAVGIYAVAGAFLCGVVVPRGNFSDALRERIEPITVRLLLPLFFIYSGLNTRFDLLFDPVVLGVLIAAVAVAFLAKGLPCMFAARAGGMEWGAAASLGALMNARGLMELILLNIGLEKGLVTPALYTVLALMTIVTTLAATPLYFLAQRHWANLPVSSSNQHLATSGGAPDRE